MYHMDISLDTDLFHDWITGAETKVVCRAKNKDDLLRAVEAAKELGMEEYKDYFLIYDACRTELEKESPEGTLTCIGFRPMEAEEIRNINYTIKGQNGKFKGNGALYSLCLNCIHVIRKMAIYQLPMMNFCPNCGEKMKG